MTPYAGRPESARAPAGQGRRQLALDMAQIASEWLDSLGPAQREVAQYAAPRTGTAAEQNRLMWYYTPTDHGGLTVTRQTPTQQRHGMRLVAAGLSNAAYVTVITIMGLENELDRLEGWRVDWGRERGRDPGLFYLRVFGSPGEGAWAWRFAGHHVSVNYLLIEDAVVSSTPCFLGADPAASPLLGLHQLRPLAGVEDPARALVRSLDHELLEAATLSERAVSDIVSGNRATLRDGDQMIHMQDLWNGRFRERRLIEQVARVDRLAEDASTFTRREHASLAYTSTPKGVSAAKLDTQQRSLLRHLVDTYIGRAPEPLADLWTGDDEEKWLDDVHFSWSGSIEPNQPHYYRLQAEWLLAEYDNTQRNANHAHSVWRDPTKDFGVKALATWERQAASR